MGRLNQAQLAYEKRMAKRNNASKNMDDHQLIRLGGKKFLTVGSYEEKKETGFKDRRWEKAK